MELAPPGATIDVFIVAGVRLYQQGLVNALSGDPRFRVVGTATHSSEAMTLMEALTPHPAVALLDIGAGRGPASARQLRAALPDVRLIALAIEDTEEGVIAWAEAGVAGFVTRDTSLEELIATVQSVAKGNTRCSEHAAAALLRRVAFLAERRPASSLALQLTRREREVVALIDRGLSNKQIAGMLCIELATVKNHVHSILQKLNVNRRGAAAAAVRGTSAPIWSEHERRPARPRG
jgi:two-component system, NarL family, nitrate/nitrite response regulator NarL